MSDMYTFSEDAGRAWRAGGWPSLMDELRRRIMDRIGGYVRRFVIETDLSRMLEVAAPPEVDIRPFTGPDWALLGDLGRSRLADQFREAAAAGRVCLVAWKRRQAIGYVWFSEKIESQHERYELPLPAEAVHVGQIDVVRGERGSGVAAALLSTGLRYFRDRGFQRSWIIVHPNDVAAMCSIASVAPSTVLGTVGRVKVLDWMRNRYLELSPPVPVVLSSS